MGHKFLQCLLVVAFIFFSSWAFRTKKAPQPPSKESILSSPVNMLATNGPVQYDHGAFGWLNTAGGPIDLMRVWVASGIKTDEGLYAECSEIAGLHIGTEAIIKHSIVGGDSYIGEKAYSKLDVDDTTFYGPVFVHGNVMAVNSSFKDLLKTSAQIMCLSCTVTESIQVSPSSNCYDTPVIKLSYGSIVKGDIHFASNKGLVIVDDSSYVNGGVYGGEVVNEPFMDLQSP